ncbi:hypothetical protein ACOMHN_048552 [Nucella lapillus]
MACQLQSGTGASEFVVCELCGDAQQKADHHCDDCLANYCERCAESHRKLSTTKKGCHGVETGVCRYDLDNHLQLELCPVDGQKVSFYCRTCAVRVCPECELDKKNHVLHDVVLLTRLLGQEKEKLLDKLDDVTTKTETISYLPDEVKSMSNQIELKWLERKELIRQEFASLFETLTTQQQKLLADMEEEVQKSLDRLSQLKQNHDTVLSSTCQLSDECISAVQSLPRNQFLNTYPQFLESVKELKSKVEHMESAKDHMPAFLQVPFSLYKEKLHLHNCLQLSAFNVQGIKAWEHQRFVPYDRLKEELSLNTLLDTPTSSDLPPSSILRYNVDIYCGSKHSKKPVWSSKKPLRAVDCVINGNHGHRLFPGNLYMVKVRPVVTCFSHVGDQTVEGRVISIVIVTDTAVGSGFMTEPAAGDSHMALPDTSGLLNYVHEHYPEDSLSCTNVAGVDIRNSNNGNSRSRGPRRNKPGKLHTSMLEPLGAPPFVRQGARGPSRDWHIFLPARACYRCAVPNAQADRAHPLPAGEPGGALMTQRRYLTDCCFEEARLMEDTSLQVSRVVLFDR